MFRRKPPPPPAKAKSARQEGDAERAARIAAMEATAERRRLLECGANPAAHTDYVVQLDGDIDVGSLAAAVAVTIRYIPDRDVLDPGSLPRYWRRLGGADWPSFEELAVTVLGDLGNELVPRWIEIVAMTESSDAAGDRTHRVVLQDRQPTWRNDALLNRLSPV